MTQRGVLIGCGFFANNHLNGWKSLPDAELVAVCDISKEKAERAATQFGISRSLFWRPPRDDARGACPPLPPLATPLILNIIDNVLTTINLS